ncbi:MAG: AAA family ATPase [Ktedonobacteraceae bacterium]
MAQQQPQNTSQPDRAKEGITRITVGGFKSIIEEQSIEVRPLTILAGANSSGKSSIMQPLLLLKQTLEAPYDPGALLLDGPNVKFTLVDQLLSRKSDGGVVDTFHVGIGIDEMINITTHFVKSKRQGFEVNETNYESDKGKFRLYVGMPQKEIETAFFAAAIFDSSNIIKYGNRELLKLSRQRSFLVPVTVSETNESPELLVVAHMTGEVTMNNRIRQIIHLPGLRGDPERTYKVSAVGSVFTGTLVFPGDSLFPSTSIFPGTFENYVASVIGQWQIENNNDKLGKVNRDLFRLGLTGKITARAIDDAHVELLVNRFPYHNRSVQDDMVSIADVGLGVSQALPVVIALHAASQGQLVYLEQPEIHLHPRAQSALAEVLADAVKEGKRVVVETHSSLLLLGIQTLVAEGKLSSEMVKLHWFTQQEDGSTKIDSADLDGAGAFGDWPEDFDRVSLDSEGRYIDAAHASLKGN